MFVGGVGAMIWTRNGVRRGRTRVRRREVGRMSVNDAGDQLLGVLQGDRPFQNLQADYRFKV